MAIDAHDYDTAVTLGVASVAMHSYARHGDDETKQRAIARLKEAAERLGFKLVAIETPAEAHDKAIAARVAEDGDDIVMRG